MQPTGYINKDGAAKELGCTTRTVDNLMMRRLIPFYKFGRSVLFKKDEVLTAVSNCRVMTQNEIPGGVEPKMESTPDDGVASAAWDSVINGLMDVKRSGTDKQVNLANAVLKFITNYSYESQIRRPHGRLAGLPHGRVRNPS